MKKIFYFALCSVCLSLFLSSCKEDEPEDPIIPNEEEVITSLIYTLTPDGGGTDVVFSFQDLDGDGGNDPVLVVGILDQNTTYNATLELLNELENPAEDITLEVQEEAEDHQFFFTSTLADLTIAYDDLDANDNPIGLSTIVTTEGINSGTMTVILRHEPDKEAAGVASGEILNAGGETDIEVTFNVEVQ